MRFEDLSLRPQTLDALRKMGYDAPTEVQEKVIPRIMLGHNVVVRSKTGTGKTAAFGIGIVERLAAGNAKKALVLAPTRELAVQIHRELSAIAANYPLRIVTVYGGLSINPQIEELRKGVDVLIATTGRLLDHTERRTVHLGEFNLVVLDEADKMLDMGFRDEMDAVMSQVPKERTVLLLSASVDEAILGVASNYMHGKPEIIEIGEKEKPAAIKEEFHEVIRRDKALKLIDILRTHPGQKVLVFTATKVFADKLSEKLYRAGFKADRLQGDMSQAARERVLQRFRGGELQVLVATDVAARGLHVDDVGLIVNYDRAADDDTHLHRVGRTGRMGAEGKAITFIDKKEGLKERFSEDHPDFAWMKQGFHPNLGGGAPRGSGRHRDGGQGGHGSGGGPGGGGPGGRRRFRDRHSRWQEKKGWQQ